MVSVDVKELGTNPKAEIFWGRNNELTFADKEIEKYAQWANRKIVPVVAGINNYTIELLNANTTYYWRFSITNDEGETWLDDTQSFTTKEISQ